MSGSDWGYVVVLVAVTTAGAFLNYAVKEQLERVLTLEVALRECEARCVVKAPTSAPTFYDNNAQAPAP